MFATLIFRVTLISRSFKNREIREINVSRKFHVLRFFPGGKTDLQKQQGLLVSAYYNPQNSNRILGIEPFL